jgi:multidrug efflux pump subunit AcrA (membrane-fusion protein)
LLGDDTVPVQAEYFDTARTVDPQTQHRGLLFLTGTDIAKLAPGMALAAYVGTGGAPATGVVVPRSAVVRFDGASWVYLQAGEDTFVRREVALDRPLTDGWFVGGDLQAGVKVVVTGAQQLLSEEWKGRGVGE